LGKRYNRMNHAKSILIFLIVLAVSCNKNYTYVEEGIKHSLSTGDKRIEKTEIIKSKSDSLAYLMSYEQFIKSKEVERRMIKMLGRSNYTPEEFTLYNSSKGVIKESDFSDIDSIKKEIENKIYSLN